MLTVLDSSAWYHIVQTAYREKPISKLLRAAFLGEGIAREDDGSIRCLTMLH